MKAAVKKGLTFSCLSLALLALIPSATMAQGREFAGQPAARPYTRDLPRIDRIELFKLKLDERDQATGIEATKTLEGNEAQIVASLWRHQTYRSGWPACHYPPYSIKFFAQGKLLVSASICWACNSIYFSKPHLEHYQAFGSDDKRSAQLLEIFKKAFPQT